MSSFTAILVVVAQQILIYGGLIVILFGMFGSAMVILIFSCHPLNQNPCSIYIVTNGILSFLFLPLYGLPNIVTFGLQINWLAFNTAFCKFQMGYSKFIATSVFIVNCLISFDRYAMSSRSARTRSWSSKKTARILTSLGLFVAACGIAIPTAVLCESVSVAPGVSICTSRSTVLVLIEASVYYPLIEGVLPIVLAVYFWWMTRKQIRSLRNQNAMRRSNKQITRMCFFQNLVNAIASFPFAAINLSRALTAQAVRTQSEEDIVEFIRVLSIWVFYVQYSTDFYIYVCTSTEIRTQAKKILCYARPRWTARVTIIQDQSNTALQFNRFRTTNRTSHQK